MIRLDNLLRYIILELSSTDKLLFERTMSSQAQSNEKYKLEYP